MRKIIVYTCIQFLAICCFAQENTTSVGENYIKQIEGKLDKAKISIDKDCTDPVKKNEAITWYLRGYIYNELAKSEPLRKLSANPAKEALEAVKKCKQLDTQQKFSPECINLLFDINTYFYNEGIKYYNQGLQTKNSSDYTKAIENFENFFNALAALGDDAKIVNHLFEHSKINKDMVFYYTGYAAHTTGDTSKAIEYYKKLISMEGDILKAKQTGHPLAYLYYAQILQDRKDNNQASLVLERATKIWPDNNDLLVNTIDVYNKAGKVDQLATAIETAIKNNPKDAKLLLKLADANNMIAKQYIKNGYQSTATQYRDKAIQTYEKIIALNSSDKQIVFKVNYNLGVIYYNAAVTKYKNKTENNRQEYEFLFLKAIPYLEAALTNDDKNKNIINMLMMGYQHTNQTSKADELEKRLY